MQRSRCYTFLECLRANCRSISSWTARRGRVRSSGLIALPCETSRGRRISTIRFRRATGGWKQDYEWIRSGSARRWRNGLTAGESAKGKLCALRSAKFNGLTTSSSQISLMKTQCNNECVARSGIERVRTEIFSKKRSRIEFCEDWGVAAVIAKQVRPLTFVLTQCSGNGKQSRRWLLKRVGGVFLTRDGLSSANGFGARAWGRYVPRNRSANLGQNCARRGCAGRDETWRLYEAIP